MAAGSWAPGFASSLHENCCHATAAAAAVIDVCRLAANLTGAATLFDIRRYKSYDSGKQVDALLNAPETKAWLRADPKASASLDFSSCPQLYRL